MNRFGKWLSASLLVALAGCGTEPSETAEPTLYGKGASGKTDSSIEAIFVDFEFDGEVIMSSCSMEEKRIEDQLLYTMGQLNGERGVGRLDTVELRDVESTPTDNGCLVKYNARMLVAWGTEHEGETEYELILPRDVRMQAIYDLFENHGTSCAKSGSHADSGSLWYYWRPKKSTCNLGDDVAVRIPVSVSPSPVYTTGKYPEYHKIWEDGALKVVTIFGKVEKGAGNEDTGVKGYNKYVKSVLSLTKNWDRVTEPENVSNSPGVEVPDVTISGTLPDGRRIEVVALLVDDVKSASSGFYSRYEKLTRDVDLLSYNGHSGLGANIRLLARKGDWQQGQYTIVFMNGCDSYAYVDSALADAHSEVNFDDPEGTKYLDILMNAMPSYFYTMADSGMTLVKGLLDVENPKTFEQLFVGIDEQEMVIVSGEQDNEFVPGFGALVPEEEILEEGWTGMVEGGNVEKDEEMFFGTPVLAEGKYRFEMEGSGDADLYIRLGEAPSVDLYDCRPYAFGTEEICEVDLNVPTTIQIMVRGWSEDGSSFQLRGSSIED